jgi:hypothetical protein
VIGRARHLQDDRLFECYSRVRASEPMDPRLAEHLADCESCAARYRDMTAFMEELAEHADADTDAVFTKERLRAQQQDIVRRIEHVGRPARVISFPRSLAGQRAHPAPAPYVRSRWIATAAAAGLFMGVALGVTFEWERQAASRSAVARALSANTVLPSRQVVVDAATPVAPSVNDDVFLSDLEVALERPRFGGELQSLDALTPHVREIRNAR